MNRGYSSVLLIIAWVAAAILITPEPSPARENIDELKRAAWGYTQEAKDLNPKLVAANAEQIFQTMHSGFSIMEVKGQTSTPVSGIIRTAQDLEKSLAEQRESTSKMVAREARENFSEIFLEFQKEFCAKPPVTDEEIRNLKYEIYGSLFFIAYSVVSSHTPDPKLLGLAAARISGLAIAILVNTGREKFCVMTYPA